MIVKSGAESLFEVRLKGLEGPEELKEQILGKVNLIEYNETYPVNLTKLLVTSPSQEYKESTKNKRVLRPKGLTDKTSKIERHSSRVWRTSAET